MNRNWTNRQVKFALQDKGEYGYKSRSMVHQSDQRRIAEILETPVQEIWPERYKANGDLMTIPERLEYFSKVQRQQRKQIR